MATLTARLGREVFEKPQPGAAVHKFDAVDDFVHDEETVSARRSLRRRVDALRWIEAPSLVPYFSDEPVAVQPAIDRQNRPAAVLDAVSERLAGTKFEADQIVTGKPVRGKPRDKRARLPRAGRGAGEAPAKLRSAVHANSVRRLYFWSLANRRWLDAGHLAQGSDVGDERRAQRVFRRASKIG